MNIGGRVEAQNSTFSEYGHVAYQIQGNDVYSNMEANMCFYIQEFHKKFTLSFGLNYPLSVLNFSRFVDNLNSGLAKAGFMQPIGLEA